MAKEVKKKGRGVVGEKRGKKERREKEREREKESDNSGEKPKRKSRNSPKQGWIKFFHDKGTPNAKIAEQENSAHQLLVHGLPGEFLDGTKGGLQERALNKLLTNLGKEEIGDRGITLQQEQIIGAHPIKPSSSSDKSPITRLTVDSRETKEKIRKAAKITKRWGSAGGHTVFLRDIPPEKVAHKRKRTPSSNEDTKMPKKQKTEGKETQRSSRSKKEEGIPRRRILNERPETKREERNRTAGAAQAKLDSEKAASEKLRLEQLEARRTKLAHQDWETQDLINKQGQRPQKPQTSGTRDSGNNKIKDAPKTVITPFRALNESENENENEDKWRISPLHKDSRPDLYDDFVQPATQETEPEVEFVFISEPKTPGGARIRPNPSPSKRYIRESGFNPVIDLDRTKHIPVVRLNRAETDAEASSEESIEMELTRDESEEEPEPCPETEEDTDEDHRTVYSEVDEPKEPTPEREVFIKKPSKSAARNKRRRHRIKTVRDQDRKHVTERIDASHPKMKVGKGATRNTRQNPRTPSAEIVSNEEVTPHS